MTIMKVGTVSQLLDGMAPRKLAEDWDNVGLLVGDGGKTVNRILFCLDTPEWVVEEAIEKKVDMIISHHPILFKAVKRITKDDALGRKLLKLIKNDIAVYAMHTNYDNAEGGMNDLLIEALGIKESKFVQEKELDRVFKLVVYIPEGHEELVKEAIFKAGAGSIGNYGECGFEVHGVGQYKPGEGTTPFIGQVDALEKTPEVRFETVVRSRDIGKVVKSMLKAHPYEEVAYDLIPLELTLGENGLGKYGDLSQDMTLRELAEKVKIAYGLDRVKVIGDLEKKIHTVSVIGGSGSDFWQKAKSKGADVLITGDVDYHTMLDAIEGGMTLIDAGHFGTEKIIMERMAERLKIKILENGGETVELLISDSNREVGITI